jgi:hypothetical protein
MLGKEEIREVCLGGGGSNALNVFAQFSIGDWGSKINSNREQPKQEKKKSISSDYCRAKNSNELMRFGQAFDLRFEPITIRSDSNCSLPNSDFSLLLCLKPQKIDSVTKLAFFKFYITCENFQISLFQSFFSSNVKTLFIVSKAQSTIANWSAYLISR